MPYTNTEYTYGEAIKEICRMVGHPIPADPAGSVDNAVQQMGTSINRALGELLTMFDWQDLTIRTTLSVQRDAPGQKEKGYALPTDFEKFIDQSQWDGTNQLPAVGPVSPQGWMTYYTRVSSSIFALTWQRREDQLFFLYPPAAATNFNYMYLSKALVIDADVPTDTKNVATKNGDQFKIDDQLVLLLGRAKYLEWKGFDSAIAVKDFLIAFNSRVGSNKGAPVLNIGRPSLGEPLITPMGNLPDTGYGS